MPHRLVPLFLAVLTLSSGHSIAQNLESIGNEKPVKISGGLSANQIFYASNQKNAREPYNYYLGGQIALDIYGMHLPFSFTYSNQQSNFRQPFNQFSIHPSYKWLTGHFGYTSSTYSNYTVNGHIMLGGSLDLTPGENWDIGITAGRLQQAVLGDSLSETNSTAYQRYGYGFKVKYGSQTGFIGLILFRSKDDINSLPAEVIEELSPEENLAASISLSKQFLKKLLVQLEYSGSALTRNLYAEKSTQKEHPLAFLPWLLQPRTSTEYYNAYNAAVSYQARTYNIGLRFEQVGADYRTHGSYFFNNNFYNLTLNSSFSALAGRVKILLNIGVQEDDPQNLKLSRSSRFVGSVNLGVNPSEKLNLNLGYSNFTTFTNINRRFLDASFLTPYDRIDTLNYYQVSQNLTLNTNYVIAKSQRSSQTAMANINIMETRDVQAEISQPTSSVFITINAGYTLSLLQSGLNLSAMLNWQKDSNVLTGTNVIGPTLALSKSYFDRKLLAAMALSYNKVSGVGLTGSSLNGRLTGSYRLGESHRFQASIIGVQRSRNSETQTVTQDLTATLGYNYSF